MTPIQFRQKNMECPRLKVVASSKENFLSVEIYMEQKVSSILTEIFMFDKPKIIVNKTFPILSIPSQDGPGTPNIYHNSYQIPHTLHI